MKQSKSLVPTHQQEQEYYHEQRPEVRINSRIDFHGPVIFGVLVFGGALSLIGLFVFATYAATHWAIFVKQTGTIFNDVLLGGTILACILIAFLAVKTLKALFDVFLGVGQGIASIWRSMSEAKGQRMKNKVVVAAETYALVHMPDGTIQMLQPTLDKNVYNYRTNVNELQATQPSNLLTPPIPTARQLLLDGTVKRTIEQGHIILGFLEGGGMKTLPYDLLYSTDLGGVGGSGKTTTAHWLCIQEIMAGTKIIVIDPHLNVKRRGLAQGLGQLLAPYKFAYHFPPCDDDLDEIMKRARWMRDENKLRGQKGINLDDASKYPQVLMVIDEFNTIIEIEEIREELGDIIAKVQREGRKLGLFFLLIGHKWAQQDIGNIKIRTNAATVMAHYYNDPDQAAKLLGGDGKLCQTLKSGSYWLRGLMTGDLCRVSTPLLDEDDLSVILDVMGQRVNYPTGRTVEADPLPAFDEFYKPSPKSDDTYLPIDEIGDTNGDTYLPPQKPAEMNNGIFLSDAQRAKVHLILEMDMEHSSQNEIIESIWKVNPKDRAGQEAAKELRLIRAYIAQQHRKSFR